MPNSKSFPRRVLFNAGVLVLALLVLSPLLWFISMSFKSDADIMAGSTQFLFTPTLEHYRGIMTPEVLKPFGNSLLASIISTVLALAIGVPGAYVLARAPTRYERPLSMAILTSRMVPPIAFTIPYFLVYRNVGLLDTVTGLIVIYLTFNLSLVVWLMRTFFEGLPRSLEEAAWIDGASLWQTMVRIVMPMAMPGIVTTAILCFIYSWNDFFFALTLTRTQAMTAPVQVVNFMNYQGWEWGKIAASGTLILLPVFLFSMLMRKYLVQGMTAGAVKA